MKRVLAVLMALVMLFSCAACTGSGNGSGDVKTYEYTTGYDETKYNAPGTLPVFKEKQTISVTLPDNQYVIDWNTNRQTEIFEEDLNADLVLNVLPSGEYNTKINLMAASGGEDFTDVVLGKFSDGMVQNLADNEVAIAITEYMYNTDIAWNMMEAKERLGWDFYPYITMPDGEIYAIPRINDSISNPYSDRMFVYKPWFDAAGIDVDSIKTMEDLKNAFNTIVKSDPNGNGKADEVGLVSYGSSRSWFKFLMNPYVYAGDEYYMVVEDGEVSFAYQKDEWKEGLKAIKEFYDLGLIDPLSFSQDSTGYKAMLNYNETIATAFVTLGVGSYISEGDPRRQEYYALTPLNSDWNDGKPLASYEATAPDPSFFVTCNAVNPEASFRFGDYMISEKMSIHQRWGEKGIDWIEPGPNAMTKYEGYEPWLVQVLPWSSKQNKHWYQTGPYIRQVAISAGALTQAENEGNAEADTATKRYRGNEPDEYIVKLIYTEDENEITTEGLKNLNTYVNEMISKYVTGIEDIDGDWDNFQNQLELMNIDEILECAQAAYDRIQAVTG